MRLIDAEKLAEYKASGISELTEQQKGWNDAIDTIIGETPTVKAVLVAELPYTVWLTHDVVQVVRCKDCKWQELCKKTLEYKGADGYCSKGERSN